MSDRIKRDPNRKSARSFNLDKPEGLSFELEKPESHKFELEKPEGHKFELDKDGAKDQQLNAAQSGGAVDKKKVASTAAAITTGAATVAASKTAGGSNAQPLDGPPSADAPETQPLDSKSDDRTMDRQKGRDNDNLRGRGENNKKKKKGKANNEHPNVVRQEPVQSPQPEPFTPVSRETRNGNGKKWAAAIAALALLGCGGYAVSNFMGANGDNGVKTEEIAQNETDRTTVDENTSGGLVDDASGMEDAAGVVSNGEVSESGNAAGGVSSTGTDGTIAANNGNVSGSSQEKSNVSSGASGTQTTEGGKGNVSGSQKGQGQNSDHQIIDKASNSDAKQGPGQQQSNNGSTGSSANATVSSDNQTSSTQSQAHQPANTSNKSTSNSVQSSVSKNAPAVTDDVEKMAWMVIRGDFGNGLERKRLLGDKYRAIQRRVNQLYRKGRVK